MSKKIIGTLLIISCWCFNVFAQFTLPGKSYPQNFFRYPLDLPPSTAGSLVSCGEPTFIRGLILKPTSVPGTRYMLLMMVMFRVCESNSAVLAMPFI
jgi:hypothetical protein